MATPPDGKIVANCRKLMSADYGTRAGAALECLVPGPHRDKVIARLFECSPRMARYLRSGQHWTVDRLARAGQAIRGFDAFIASSDPLQARINKLQRELDEVRQIISGESGE